MRSLVLPLLAAVSGLSRLVNAHPGVQTRQATGYAGYAFVYFTGNTIDGEKIYLAASNGNNALDWQELNGGKPVLSSTKGTKGLRDPFIIRSKDGGKFYLLATDLSIGSGTDWGSSVRNGSRYLEIWETSDLVNWSAQRHVRVSPPTAGNTWAPEAYYDEASDEYVVYWASSLYAENDPNHTGTSYHRMMYATTKDFVTFSAPQVWQDAGTARIDSTVVKSGGTYYRFTKDEGGVTGCTDIIQESSTRLLNQLNGWTTTATCIGRNAGTGAIEGPTAFRANAGDVNGNKFYLFVDEYSGRGYIPLETPDIANPAWRVSPSYKLPKRPRHGTVISLKPAELQRLTSTSKAKRDESQLSMASALIPGLYADPNIAIFGCNYYIYATTDGTPGWGGNQFFVWKSSDLISWTRSSTALLTLNGTSGNVPWATGNAWAPTIAQRNHKFYFYFSGHNPTYNRKTIGAAVSSSPEGPFVAQSAPFILNNEPLSSNQAIDPQAFLDPVSNTHYLYWGNGRPLMAQLAPDMLSLVPGTTRALANLTDFREGAFVVYRRGIYHFTYSIDDTGSANYRVGYATGPAPTGPWTFRGVILQKDPSQGILATGHNSIVNVPGTDDWYIAYHRFQIPGGNGTHRETTMDRLEFAADGLIKTVVPTLEGPSAQLVCKA